MPVPWNGLPWPVLHPGHINTGHASRSNAVAGSDLGKCLANIHLPPRSDLARMVESQTIKSNRPRLFILVPCRLKSSAANPLPSDTWGGRLVVIHTTAPPLLASGQETVVTWVIIIEIWYKTPQADAFDGFGDSRLLTRRRY